MGVYRVREPSACARACQDMSTLVSLVVLLRPWARAGEQVCLRGPARRALETLLASLQRAGRQPGGSGPAPCCGRGGAWG